MSYPKEYVDKWKELVVECRKWTDENYEKYYDLEKKIPMKLIPIVDIDICISLADWKYVMKECPGLNPYSDPEELAEGHIAFQESMGEYILLDCNQNMMKRGKWYIFTDGNGIIYRQEHPDPEYYIIEAYTSYLIDD